MPLFPTSANTYLKATGLPPPWEVRWSNSKKLPYFHKSDSKESKWEPPAGADAKTLRTYIAANFPPGEISAAHLLVKHKDSRNPKDREDKPITRTKEEARIMLEGFEKRIQSGEVKLMQLATTQSDCKSGAKMGQLGFFGHGQMQKEFEEAAFKLRPGEMSGIVETASGLHLIERIIPEAPEAPKVPEAHA